QLGAAVAGNSFTPDESLGLHAVEVMGEGGAFDSDGRGKIALHRMVALLERHHDQPPRERPTGRRQRVVERSAEDATGAGDIEADTARAFARAGYAVVLGARDAGALSRVVDDIEKHGGRAVAAKTDVGDVDSMRALVELAVESFGRLDAAFNNATDGPMPSLL